VSDDAGDRDLAYGTGGIQRNNRSSRFITLSKNSHTRSDQMPNMLGYCFAYGLPSAAGGTVRPITPARAIIVRTYGKMSNSADACGE
jgi:hypothetical protein